MPPDSRAVEPSEQVQRAPRNAPQPSRLPATKAAHQSHPAQGHGPGVWLR